MISEGTPVLSTIVVCRNAAATILACLRSVATDDPRCELIVVDSSEDRTPELVRSEFPQTRLVHSTRRLYPGEARNTGAAQARGRIIAFIDADCIASPGWTDAVIAAHELHPNVPIIGGTVDNATPHSIIGTVSYFCEFSQWAPERRERYMDQLPTCCFSIKREALAKLGPFPDGGYCSDTVLQWRVDLPQQILFMVSFGVAHINLTHAASFVAKFTRHGRYFARARVAHFRFSLPRRLLHVVTAPALPWLLFARRFGWLLRKRYDVTRFLVCAPLVLLGLACWSLGEVNGYLEPAKETT